MIAHALDDKKGKKNMEINTTNLLCFMALKDLNYPSYSILPYRTVSSLFYTILHFYSIFVRNF